MFRQWHRNCARWGVFFFVYSILQVDQGYDKMQVGYVFPSSLVRDILIGLWGYKNPIFLYYYLVGLSTSKYIQ